MAENQNDRYILPFHLGSELTAESFKLSQNDHSYRLAAQRYRQFYESYIRPRQAMYRGWIEGFHNTEFGVIPTLFLQKIGKGIVSTILGKRMILNSKEEKTNKVTENEYKKSNFQEAVKEGYSYALEGGTALLKWNRDGKNQLKAEALPMDKFFVTVDAYDQIEKVKSYIATYHDTVGSTYEYYLCEERFFRYAKDGKRYPMVHYMVYRTSGNITQENMPTECNAMRWNDLPHEIRKMLQRDFGDIYLDSIEGENLQEYNKCILLPFEDDLGCRLIKFTQNIPSFPKLPFGQPLADLLMNESYAYDQLKFFERMEVYIARGRIMIDKGYENPNDPDSRKSILDPMVFTYYTSLTGESDDKKPQGLQLEMRADAIRQQKQNILNDTALSLNISSSTIASWLSDGQTQKTATEIGYERTKTTEFINDKVELIQRPLEELVAIFYHYYGALSPSLHIMSENQIMRTEMIYLYSELYDKGQITARMLAKEILGTCSNKEIEELTSYIEAQKETGQLQQQIQPIQEDRI